MQHEMIPLFSVPLIKMNIGELDQVSRAWIRGLDYPSQRTGTDHSDDDLPMMNRGMKILEKPQMKDLRYKIQNALNYFVDDVLGVVQNFQITTSWVNKTSKSEYIDKHSHPNSIISGVYYVDKTKKCAPIIFSKPHMYPNITFQNIQLAYSGENKNQYNTDYYGVNPIPGDLLMFPSWLEHEVLEQGSEHDRISLAFNSYPKGDIGEGTKQLRIL